jgi:hypothetical protein
MNGSLALHVALALHGNAWFAAPDGPAPALAGSSTFQYVRSFAAGDAHSTVEWFETLRADGVRRLELGCALPRNADDVGLTAFAGVDPWVLHAVGAGQTWSGTMTFADDAERQAPWDVVLRRVEGGPAALAPSLEEATRRLRQALSEATAVAQHRGWAEWGRWFGDAGLQLEAAEPVPRFHPDLAPADALGLGRRRLLAGAVGSWVFGGMGSWNDIALEDQREQRELEAATVGLYSAIVTALMAVVNG